METEGKQREKKRKIERRNRHPSTAGHEDHASETRRGIKLSHRIERNVTGIPVGDAGHLSRPK